MQNTMLDVLQKLNKDKDRCVLIGRNALNLRLIGFEGFKNGKQIFRTYDFDVVCPDLKTAQECQDILEKEGFTRGVATFKKSKDELDILTADPQYPEADFGNYYNAPGLRTLWNSRERKDGILTSDPEKLIWDKLLHARNNEGKDTETISIFFEKYPEKLAPLLKKINDHQDIEEKDKILFSLLRGVEKIDSQKEMVEKTMLSYIENNTANTEEIINNAEINVQLSEEFAMQPVSPITHAILRIKAMFGELTYVMEARNNRTYTGAIVDITKDYAIQDTGDAIFVLHDLKELEKLDKVSINKEEIAIQTDKSGHKKIFRDREDGTSQDKKTDRGR